MRASIVIPTHDHAATLPFTVASALAQTEPDLEVIIVGDGVTQGLRDVAAQLVAGDPRVRFLDLPKGPHHGEIHRHTAVQEARGSAILYLCDDDLLLPDHVSDLTTLLESHDFVQSLNGHVDTTGHVYLYPGDLGDPRFVGLLLDPDRQINFVSVTGTAHTRAFYDAVAQPWSTTPAGRYPDHYQWQRMLGHGPFRAATSARMTALQFPSHLDGRAELPPDRRVAELGAWAERISRPGAQEAIDALVGAAARQQMDEYWRQADDAFRSYEKVRAELDAVRGTRSWRIMEPLRALRRRLPRRV